jgi:hypothetical protein
LALKDSSGAAGGVTVSAGGVTVSAGGVACCSAGGVTVSAGFDLQATKARPRTSNMTINTVTNLYVLFAMVPPFTHLSTRACPILACLP